MRVLITGGTGFIGLATAEALRARGHQVSLFALAPMPATFADAPSLAGIMMLKGDIRSESDITAAVRHARPDVVLHLAALTPDLDAEQQIPATVIEVNIGGTATLLKVLKDTAVAKVVTTSSVAVYGQVEIEQGPIVEDIAQPNPTSLYGITKLAAENTAMRLASLYGLDLSIARLGPVFGPWEYATGVRPLLSPQAQVLAQWRQGQMATLSRPMNGDWLYSRDAAAALVALLTVRELKHVIYNIGPGQTETIEAWASRFSSMAATAGVRISEQDEAPNVMVSMPSDRAALAIERLSTDTDYFPKFCGPLADTDYASWLKQFDPITKGTPE
jgi:UDP-glucose 4-epimerase